MKMAEINLSGVTYPLCYSALVMMHIEDRGETVADAIDKIVAGSVNEKMFLLSEMLEAAYLYNTHIGVDSNKPPTGDFLPMVVGLEDFEAVNTAILKAITAGRTPTVEVEQAKKEEGATQAQ